MSQPSASRQLVRRDLALAQRALRGSPTAAARRAAACRSPASSMPSTLRLDEERRVRRVAHAADDLELGRAERLGELGGRQFQRGHRCPAGSIGCSHSGHGGRPPATASAPRAAIARTCGAGRVDARDVAARRRPRSTVASRLGVVVVVLVGGRSRSSMSTSSRSGSKPSPIRRARNSGTVGSRSCGGTRAGIAIGILGVLVGDPVEERDRLGREQRDLLLLDEHGELRVLGAGLDVERALPGLADRAGAERVDVVELDDLGHHARLFRRLVIRRLGRRRVGRRRRPASGRSSSSDAGVVALHHRRAVRPRARTR